MLPVIANLNSIMRKEVETCNLFIRDVMKKLMLTRLETVVSIAARMKMKVRLIFEWCFFEFFLKSKIKFDLSIIYLVILMFVVRCLNNLYQDFLRKNNSKCNCKVERYICEVFQYFPRYLDKYVILNLF